MFNFNYSLFVGSFLRLLMMAEAGCISEPLVGLGIWVEQLDVKKCLSVLLHIMVVQEFT